MVTAKVSRGRPRDPGTDAAILRAAAQILADRGDARMTVAAVAALAGVSEPTVYLRYPTKRDLAMAAVTHVEAVFEPPDTGDAFEDLTLFLSHSVTRAEAAGFTLTGVVLAEERDHPELLEQWRATVGTAYRSAIERIVERGQHRGQLAKSLNTDLVTDLLLGANLAHYTFRGQPGRGWARQVIAALRPVLEKSTPGLAARRRAPSVP